ncbi:MAG: OmpA family protein [Bacteroidales bacterium]|nr:OmpA family protein [Bacteroidales bacterium]
MKQKLLLLTALLFAAILSANAQISIKNILKNSKEKAESKIENRIENKIDNAVDNALDDVEGKNRKGKNRKGKQRNQDSEDDSPALIGSDDVDESASGNSNQNNSNLDTEATGYEGKNKKNNPVVSWSKFDFVPGDNVIFQDGPDIMEENGEFPSRWDLVEGQVEIANVDGENVIMFIDGSPEIIPYMENSSEDYLPEIFTVEFDMYRPGNGNRFSVYLWDRKNQRAEGNREIQINLNRVDAGPITSTYESGKDYEEGNWIHVSIAFTKGKLKIYLDENRLINIPRYEGNPSGLSIQAYWAELAEDKAFYLKNVTISEGGVKYYDRAMQDGKIVVNGIRFDIGKATLKPESMGPINKIYELMTKKPDLNFSVEGHTDSDGNDATNQTLSENRAKTVMDKLIEMGIDKSRLKSQGFGEAKPVSDNTSAEGKAQNRRVEFVKF